MQKQKFKVNDKVKIISTAFGLQGEIGTVEVVDAVYGSNYCRVSANTEVCYTSQEIDIGRFGTNSWRYGFYEHELELVKDEPKFKIGDLVVHPSLGRGVVKKTEALDCNKYKVNVLFGRDNEWVLMEWDIEHYKEVSKPEPEFSVGDEVLLGGCLAEVVSVKQYDTTTLIGVKQGSCFFMVGPKELQHYNKDESEVAVENTQKLHQDLKESFEYLLSKEPSYVIGQEVYVAAGITRDLKRATIIDAVPREGLLKVNVSGFDCFVEEERVYTKETKGE